METLSQLTGKQIRSIELIKKIEIAGYEYSDDILRITFTDDTTWILASWDHQEYSSGLAMLINGQRVHT